VFVQVLVEDKIRAGAMIREELRKAGFPISATFWCRIPESGYWRLVIGSALIDRIGPMKGYQRLHTILDHLGMRAELSGSISLLSPHDPSFKRLLQYASSPGQFGVAGGEMIPFNPFQDAYFYN
jgi:hypothetical protein